MRIKFVFLSLLFTLNGFAQELSSTEIADFKKEGLELVSYLQFSLNAIGDNDLSPKEKDIIISESYLKMFRNAKVQIEDDLDASREAVTNKDVQAYLKDVDFFFTYAHFTFNVLSIDVQTDEKGNPYLLTNVLRSLLAVDIKGDTVKNDQQRFIEIELDSDKRELKIASIYTTKLNENEENIRWWNLLSEPWKKALGAHVLVLDSIPFSSVYQLSENYLVVESKPLTGLAMSNNSAGYVLDTIRLNNTSLKSQKENVIKGLNQILEISDLNLSHNEGILDLEPINRLSNLRTLDVSFTQIQDISPARNLTNLHNLNCSNTFISSVDALVYSMGLAILNISNTNVKSLDPIANLSKLVILDISNTEIDNLDACVEMTLLEDLKMRNTLITDLTPLGALTSLIYLDLSNNQQLQSLDPLKQLSNLKVLYISNTMISDLTPLAALSHLETLYCENAEITSLNGLELLPNLKKVYCDNSMLGRQKAIDFMKEHPKVLVVYESKQLKMWWDELPEAWKSVFSKIVTLDSVPSKEQLHEITNITEINIAGNPKIRSLLPLEKLKNLQKLDASSSGITSLDGIAEAREMRVLNISKTIVPRIYIIESLNLIEELNISFCPVMDLSPIVRLVNLKRLTINNTPVDNLSALEDLQNLRYLNADSTYISNQQFDDFIEHKKDILVIFESEALRQWWDDLSSSWKSIFKDRMKWIQDPNTEDLHSLIQIQTLEIKENRAIGDLSPLEKLKHLRNLTVNDTKITDLSPLLDLVYLQELDLSRNPITDLSPLNSLTNLEFVYLNNTPVDNLDWLEDLSKIKILDISSTEIRNLKVLSKATHLQKLIAYSTRINNITPLEKLPDLVLLKIYNSNVSSKRVDYFKEMNPNCAVDYY